MGNSTISTGTAIQLAPNSHCTLDMLRKFRPSPILPWIADPSGTCVVNFDLLILKTHMDNVGNLTAFVWMRQGEFGNSLATSVSSERTLQPLEDVNCCD